MKNKTALSVFGLLLFTILFISKTTYAQNSFFTIATKYEIKGENIKPGMIVTNDGQSITVSKFAYDPNIFGIIVNSPAITIGKKVENAETYEVSTIGTVSVLITNENGVVKKGDYITSSSIDGVGMRADQAGRVVGMAVSDSKEEISGEQLVLVSLNYENIEEKALRRVGAVRSAGSAPFLNQLSLSSLSEYFPNSGVIKLIGIIVILVMTFSLSVLYYTQISKKEVEALGRNPLATKTIEKNMVLHGAVAVLICVGGLLLSMAVLLL